MNGTLGRIGMTRGLVVVVLAVTVLVAPSVVALGQSGCGDCGGLPPKLQGLIGRMQSAPISFTRDAAAHDLRAYDWRQYPQILDALCATLISDPIAHVRSEAAQTLLSIQPVPCVPEVRSALARAVASERNPFARSWIRKALARVEQNCGSVSSGGCSPCDAGQIVTPPTAPMGGSEPVLLDPVPLETSVRETQVQRAQAIQVQPQAKVRSRPRPSEIPQEAPLDMLPESPSTSRGGPAPEAEPTLSTQTRSSEPLVEPELSPTVRRAPAPPAPGAARETGSTDLFGKLPPITDTPTDSGDPLPEKLPKLSEPDLNPPAPPAEAASPFGRAAQSDNSQPGQKRDRFASNMTTRRAAPQQQATSYKAKPVDNGPFIGDVELPEPTVERRRVQPLRIFQRQGR